MKTTIAAFLVLMQVALSAQTYITDDTISGTWTQAESPYFIMNDVIVTNLVIEPGVEVVFTGYYSFEILAENHPPFSSLIAIGTENDSIRFTVQDTTGYHNNTHTGWAGFGVIYESEVVMKYCIVEYSKSWGLNFENSGLY